MTDDRLLEALRSRCARAPATASALAVAERALGFRLPTLLRRIYVEVADGGVGPGHGVLPLGGEGLVELHGRLHVERRLPTTLLPICDWGCAVTSCLDGAMEDGPIVTLAGQHPPTNTGRDLRGWLSAWLSGVDLWREMFGPGPKRTITNPFTRERVEMEGAGAPRGRPWP